MVRLYSGMNTLIREDEQTKSIFILKKSTSVSKDII